MRPGGLTGLLVGLLLCGAPLAAESAEDLPLPLRNHNPFLQVYGLPVFESALLTANGTTSYRFGMSMANHADSGFAGDEAVVLDGETYFLDFSVRHGIGGRLEVGLDLPFVAHTGGRFDDFIEDWHDWFGLTNSNRQGPGNQLRFMYAGPGDAGFDLTSARKSLGELRLSAAIRLGGETETGDSSLALRATLKLPTGDQDRLLGSGAADLAIALHGTDRTLFGRQRLAGSAFAGVLLLGDGDILPGIQNDTVAFGGVSTTWQLTSRLAATAQLYAQGSYFDSRLDELGGNSVALAAGGIYHFDGGRTSLRFGIVEDLFSDATTDVAFHVGLQIRGR